MRTRPRYLPLIEAETGMVLGTPVHIARQGQHRYSLPAGHRLTEDNLRLSFEQRALQHQAALDLALEIERAGRKLRERSANASAAT